MNLRATLRATVLMLIGGAGLVSCNGNAPPTGSDNPSAKMNAPQGTASGTPQRATPTGAANAATGGRASNSAMAEEVPPAGARFTLFCAVFHGPGHVEQAKIRLNQLINETNLHGWHLLHSEDQTTLYYGYYRTIDDVEHDPQEVQRAQADRRTIESLKDPLSDRLFPNSVFVGVNAPDPEAPPEWNLAHAPANAFWSVQVAAYQGSPERKQLAVDAVRQLRAQGKTAFYYHGETVSSICIGTWPREAVRAQGNRDDAHTSDPNRPIVVFNDQPPAELVDRLIHSDQHPEIAAPKLEIEDATLQTVLKEYPYHAVNGEYRGRPGPDGTTIPDPSFLVQIPHSADNGYAASSAGASRDDAARNPADSATNAILDQQQQSSQSSQPSQSQPQQQPAPSNLGHLRSIGDR